MTQLVDRLYNVIENLDPKNSDKFLDSVDNAFNALMYAIDEDYESAMDQFDPDCTPFEKQVISSIQEIMKDGKGYVEGTLPDDALAWELYLYGLSQRKG